MVIRETLSGDLRSGLWTASAPIFTDGPLIIVSFLFASLIADNPGILVFISILGAAFMFKMGVECFKIEPPSVAIILEPISSRKAFGRGVLTNLLNPNVYVFWFLIGGPIMAASVEAEPLAPIAYAASFILCIILVKCGVALAIYRLREGMPIHIYKAVLTACGFAMILFAAGYLGFAWTQIQAM
jgi:threonine/homoserine/homoserine lactone efflux protein